MVEGIAGLKENDSTAVIPVAEAPVSTIQVLATCHSLVQLEDGLVGDPLEKATLTAIDWTLTKADVVIPHKSKVAGMKIFHRNYFSSSLKRMSVVAGYNIAGSAETHYFAAIKGAPEILRPMVSFIRCFFYFWTLTFQPSLQTFRTTTMMFTWQCPEKEPESWPWGEEILEHYPHNKYTCLLLLDQ